MVENEIQYIDIDKLKLDELNPRLPKKNNAYTQNSIIEYMLMHGAILPLMQSIATNGFFAGEALVIIPDPKDEDFFIVVEGNRRLSALMLLNNPSMADIKQKTILELSEEAKQHNLRRIPCVRFTKREETLKFLGFKHIVGVKNWSALEKARYVINLRNETVDMNLSLDDQCKSLAKMIGSRSDYIKRLLVGLELYEMIRSHDFYGIDGLNESTFTFVNLSDSLNRSNLPEFFGVDFESEKPTKKVNFDNLSDWTHWFFEKKDGKTALKGTSTQLSLLDEVVKNADALDFFKKTRKLVDAHMLVNQLDDIFAQYIFNANEYLIEVLRLKKKNNIELDETLIDDIKRAIDLCHDILD